MVLLSSESPRACRMQVLTITIISNMLSDFFLRALHSPITGSKLLLPPMFRSAGENIRAFKILLQQKFRHCFPL